MRAVLLVALLAGCTTQQVFVRTITIRSHEIVVEKCSIEYRGDVARGTDQCIEERLPIPAMTPSATGDGP